MRKILILIALLFMAGCSTKFVYKNLDWLTYWYVDDYIALTDEQEAHFDKHLQTWLDWHKAQELDTYIAQLNEIKADVSAKNITPERVAYHQMQMLAHWYRFRDKIVPDLAQLAPMLSKAQVEELFNELAESESESIEKRQRRSEQKRKKRWEKNRINNLERWLGQLNDEQKTLVEQLYEQQLSTADLWYDYRVDYQAQLKALFEKPNRDAQFVTELQNLLTNPEQFRSQELQARIAHNKQFEYQFLTNIYRSLSEKQRTHLLKELDELIDDLSSLKK
ncbi:DUF6279 family lipoprotein [Pseudoalteromonas sp. S16_S37]|uniref:DUF6279 family lipoprotein n=1 Tax=Pseudoalteromonas sp. S16_S37 TaxID=2720228 RepID=UPI001681AE27|nr:DUF6279 family lipoprotein [Pseudoalteromonas sp. S16_S37]MBD1584784.1 hypothetical protein [Pseudoalteromonas sp. S16_S37]